MIVAQGYTRGDWICAIWHRFFLRAWRPGTASLGIGYGPADECTRCGRGWGTAWAGDRIR
jgi:hypothetical protein